MPVFSKNTLVLAIGNASRGDDGLGWAFAEALEASESFPGDVILRYQLQIEDAELCARYDRVIFVDAWKTDTASGFLWEPCVPTSPSSFTTHALPPSAVLYLCSTVFDAFPESWLLLLPGNQWELGDGLSTRGQEVLNKAIEWFTG